MAIEKVLVELQSRINAEECRLTEDDVSRWTGELGVSRDVLYDAIAACFAFGFHRRELTFEFCDRVVTGLFGAANGDATGSLFRKVFLAFDDGEYHHRGQPHDEDPVEAFTRPKIAEIVRALGEKRFP